MKSFICAIFVTIVATSALCSCNTVKGFGQDMQRGGQELQHAADKSS